MYMKGFPGGIYYDGTLSFIGTIDKTSGTITGTLPVRINGATNLGYIVGDTEASSSTNLRFLEASPNLVWKTTTPSTMGSVTKPILWTDGLVQRGIGRIRIQNFTIIGKVIMRTTSSNIFYYNYPSNKTLITLSATDSFEMLSCL
jgi:hypothetical protein